MPPSCMTNRRVTRNITRPVNPHDHTCRGPRANGGARYYIRVEGSASAFTASEGGKLSQGFHESARAARAHDPEAYFLAWFDCNEKDALCGRQGKKRRAPENQSCWMPRFLLPANRAASSEAKAFAKGRTIS